MHGLALVIAVGSGILGASSISGQVTTMDGAAVSGARVFMEAGLAAPLLETRSSPDDGAFRFDDVPRGIVGVFALADGYAFSGCSVNVRLGEAVEGMTIRLEPPATVSGKAVDIQGKPVAGARVSPVLMTGDAKVGIPLVKLRVFGFPECVTGANGAFTLERLPQSADVLLKVNHPLYAQEGLSDIDVGDLAIRVILHSGVLVQGNVLSRDDGIPVVNARIVIQNTQPPKDSVVTQTDSRGEFTVRLKPGIYLYQAGGTELRSPGWAKLIVTGQTTEQRVTLRVAGTASLFGQVADAKTGVGIPNVDVTLSAFGSPAELVRTGPDGEYELRAAEGDNVVAIASSPGYLAPERGAIRLSLAEGERKELPTFWLAPIPSYSLQVLDENKNPCPDAVVSVLRPAQFGWRATDEDGRVDLQLAVVPEDGKTVGLAEHRTQPLAALFALKPADASNAKVQLLPLSTVRGRIANAKGKPLEGVVVGAVFAQDAYDPPLPFWRTLSGKEGAFEWNCAVPYVPLRCVALAGEGAFGLSARFVLEPETVKDLGNLVVAEGEKAATACGKPLRWYEQPLVAGEMPPEESCKSTPAVVLYTGAQDAPMVAESLAQAQTIVGPDAFLFVLSVTGPVALPGSPSVVVVRGSAPAAATTYVLDSVGKVVLETFGMPPLKALQQVEGSLASGEKAP